MRTTAFSVRGFRRARGCSPRANPKRSAPALLALLVGLLASDPAARAEDEAAASAADKARGSQRTATVRILLTPASQAQVDQPLVLRAEVTAGWRLNKAQVHYRRMGERHYRAVELRRSSTGGYAATIPAKHVVAPGLEYYVTSHTRDGSEHHHFASAEQPYQVTVHDTEATTRLQSLLARHGGNRSRFKISGGFVDFGKREAAGKKYDDTYWQLGVDYTYRLLTWLYSIRIGGGLLLSDTLGGVRDPDPPGSHPDKEDPGIYFGFSEVRFRFHELFGARLKVLFGVTREEFSFGGGTSLIFGHAPGTHVELGFEGAIGIGMQANLRLAWDTVPGFPMGASVGVTNYPGNGDAAVQFQFDVQRHLTNWWAVAVRIGYQARDYDIGGLSIGGWMDFEF